MKHDKHIPMPKSMNEMMGKNMPLPKPGKKGQKKSGKKGK